MKKLWERLRWSRSVRAQFLAVFLALVVGLLLLLNTYPLLAIRDLVFTNKRAALQNQATVVSTALGALEALSEEGVSQVMALLDVMVLDRVVVTDETAKILYDTSKTNPSLGRYARFPEVEDALSGETAFFYEYTDGCFNSRLAVPVRAQGLTIGAVYLSESDAEQGSLLSQIQRTLINISLVVVIPALALIALLIRALTRRVTQLVQAIHIVRDGAYDYRMEIRGEDELSELGREFNNLTSRLQSTEELRRRFVSDASHELKTPLASIRLLTDSIVQSEDMDMETIREFVSDIGEEAERLGRTTEKLLSLTRMDGAVVPAREVVDLKAVAEKTLHLLAPLARAQSVQLRWELAEGCRILASRDDIYQVIFNLAENGIKYNVPDGSVSLRLFARDGQAVLEAADTGIGIPPEDLPHIFSRFYRVDKARSRKSGGSGLGLSIVHDAVALYGGTVTVEPNRPQGSRFIVRFPLWEDPGPGTEGSPPAVPFPDDNS